MSRYTIRTFRGISPRDESASLGPNTQATLAKNVDLSRGVCKPLRSDLVIESGHSGPQFAVHGDSILSGIQSPVSLFSKENETLIFRLGSQWRKKIGNSEVSLGVDRPDSPTLLNVSMPAPGEVTLITTAAVSSGLPDADERVYYVTWISDNGSTIYESKAAQKEGKASLNDNSQVQISRPINAPAKATHWRVYRLDNGRTAKLVDQGSASGVGTGRAELYDDKAYSELGEDLGDESNQTYENYTFSYVITWERLVNGIPDESGPSTPVRISQATVGTKITRPISAPTGVSTWNIYRISEDLNPTTDFELVARVPVSESSYEDYMDNRELGDVIPTSYSSTGGFLVQAEKPPAEIVAMAGPHNGMLFGWGGGTIYYSEVGEPDYWSEFYKLEAKGEVVSCVPIAVGVVVITKQGVQIASGNQPLAITLADAVTGYGGISSRLVAYGSNGIFFMSKAGLISVSAAGQVVNVSEKTLGDDYFEDYNFGSAILESDKEKVYLSSSAGTTIFDLSTGTVTTTDEVYLDMHPDRKESRLLGLKSSGEVVAIGKGDITYAMVYQTADIVLGNPQEKRFVSFQLFGEGELTMDIEVDGTTINSRLMDMSSNVRRNRVMKLPRSTQGRSARIKLQGIGTVKEIQVEVELAPIEVVQR